MTHPAVEAVARAMSEALADESCDHPQCNCAYECERLERSKDHWRQTLEPVIPATLRALLDVPVSVEMEQAGWEASAEEATPSEYWDAMLSQLVKEMEGEAHDK
jgi:hypothetical protein